MNESFRHMTEDAPTVASQTAPLIVPPSGFLYTDACLIHIYPTGTLLGRRYALNRDPIMLGRGEECEICIQDSSVSRCHAYIEPTDSGYVISDRGSTNGTFINDERIPGRTELRDGDSLRIGKCLYRYLAGGNIEAAYHEEIYRVMILDGLTQVHNRRYLNEFLDIELARSQRYARRGRRVRDCACRDHIGASHLSGRAHPLAGGGRTVRLRTAAAPRDHQRGCRLDIW
jgi:hypothetical protein